VRHVELSVSSSLLGKLFAVMEEPFSASTRLRLSSKDGNGPVIPGGFLGRSAPRLREISFSRIPFQALPTLLSSASDLFKRRLRHIPLTPFTSPEVMVACLATLTMLEDLSVVFPSPTTRPDGTPASCNTYYPSQNHLFQGVSK